MEAAYTTSGGWLKNRYSSTGARSSSSNINKCIVAGYIILTAGTGAHFDDTGMPQCLSSTTFSVSHFQSYEAAAPLTRTAKEDVTRIREVISPSISDLARFLRVSRQTIYNWLNGEPPTQEHVDRIKDLALAADVFADAGIPVNPALLRRKVSHGKNFTEIVRDGGSAQNAANLLAVTIRQETSDRQRIAARFAQRRQQFPTVDADFTPQSID